MYWGPGVSPQRMYWGWESWFLAPNKCIGGQESWVLPLGITRNPTKNNYWLQQAPIFITETSCSCIGSMCACLCGSVPPASRRKAFHLLCQQSHHKAQACGRECRHKLYRCCCTTSNRQYLIAIAIKWIYIYIYRDYYHLMGVGNKPAALSFGRKMTFQVNVVQTKTHFG